MYTFSYKDWEINCRISETNIHIVDSFKIKNKQDMKAILLLVKAEATRRNILFRRTFQSWLKEWQAHNFLYNRNIKKLRTGSVDLNENESLFKLLIYNLLAIFY